MAEKTKKVDLPALKKQFAGWQVPSEDHFAQLIDIAALSLQPGEGLSGGDLSTEDGIVDAGSVVALSIKAGEGMQVATTGIGLHLAKDGGLVLCGDKGKSLCLEQRLPQSGLEHKDGGLAVHTRDKDALKVGADGAITIVIDPLKGLKCDASGLGLNVDNQTLEVGGDDRLQVKCQEGGGLKLDENGFLTLDIDIILGRACIRVHHGQVNIFLPKSRVSSTDKIMFFINSTYCGEIHSTGVNYVKKGVRRDAGEFWGVTLTEWVQINDIIQARLFRPGDYKANLLASHTVTEHENAPTHLPLVTDLTVSVKESGPPVEGKTLECHYTLINSGSKTDNSYYRWEWYEKKYDSWSKAVEGRTFSIPSNYVGYLVRVRVTPRVEDLDGHEMTGPMAFSRSILIK